MKKQYGNGGLTGSFGVPSFGQPGLPNPYTPKVGMENVVNPINGAEALNPNNAATGKASGWGQVAGALTTGLGQMLPKSYDTRVGMARPNFIRSMSDATFTTMGASVGGGWGALVGGIIDTGKNIAGYVSEKGKYNTAVNKFQNDNSMQQRLDTMGADYTGAAKYGMRVPTYESSTFARDGIGARQYQNGGGVPMYENGGGIPVELEQNEAVLMPQSDGSYQWLGKTATDAPSHEEGGVNMNLPEGALVFPGKYVKRIKDAHANNDWSSIKAMEGQMMQESKAAAQAGKPYSSGGLFEDGGVVEIAKTIKEYDPIKDDNRESASKIFESIRADSQLSNDDRDMLVMGLTSRIKSDASGTKLLKEKYPDHYNYFVGQGTDFGAVPEQIPDQLTDEYHGSKEQMAMSDSLYKSDVIGYGTKRDGKHYESDLITAKEIPKFNASEYYSYLKPKNTTTNSTTPDTSKTSTSKMPGTSATPITGTVPGTNGNAPAATVTATVGSGDRTATRHAAMKSRVYLGGDGTPLTYWDDKAGKRMFTSAAKKYDPSYVGEFNSTGLYKAQPKYTAPAKTTTTKSASEGIPTVTLDKNGEAQPTGNRAAFSTGKDTTSAIQANESNIRDYQTQSELDADYNNGYVNNAEYQKQSTRLKDTTTPAVQQANGLPFSLGRSVGQSMQGRSSSPQWGLGNAAGNVVSAALADKKKSQTPIQANIPKMQVPQDTMKMDTARKDTTTPAVQQANDIPLSLGRSIGQSMQGKKSSMLGLYKEFKMKEPEHEERDSFKGFSPLESHANPKYPTRNVNINSIDVKKYNPAPYIPDLPKYKEPAMKKGQESPKATEHAVMTGEEFDKNDRTNQSKYYDKDLNMSNITNLERRTPKEQEKIVVGMMLDMYTKKAMHPSNDDLNRLKIEFRKHEEKYGIKDAMFKDHNTPVPVQIEKMKKQYQKEFGTLPYESFFKRPPISSQDFIATLPKKVSSNEEWVEIRKKAINSGLLDTDAQGARTTEAERVYKVLNKLHADLIEQEKANKRKYTWADDIPSIPNTNS